MGELFPVKHPRFAARPGLCSRPTITDIDDECWPDGREFPARCDRETDQRVPEMAHRGAAVTLFGESDPTMPDAILAPVKKPGLTA